MLLYGQQITRGICLILHACVKTLSEKMISFKKVFVGGLFSAVAIATLAGCGTEKAVEAKKDSTPETLEIIIEKAKEEGKKPVSWTAGVIIGCIWLAVIFLVGRWIFQLIRTKG